MANPELQEIVVAGQGVQAGRTWRFDAIANHVRFSAQTDGGDKELSWDLDAIGNLDRVLPNEGALVTLYDDEGPLWQGVFMRFTGDPWVGGAGVAYVAEGMGVLAGKTEIPYKLVFRKNTSFVSAIQQAFGPVGGWIEVLAPRLHVGDSFAADSPDFKRRTPQEVLKAICSYASGLEPPLRWHVRCNREQAGSSSYLEVLPYDTTPKYFVNMGEGVDLHPTADLGRVVNQVCVKWTQKHELEILEVATFESDGVDIFAPESAVGNQTLAQPTTEELVVQDDYSITELGLPPFCKTIDATNDIFDAQSARALADRQLTEFGRMRTTGGSLTMDYGVRVFDQAGRQVPLWRIYPGVEIEITDVTVSDRPYFGQHYPIVGMEWDELERKVTLQLGELNTLDRQVLHVVARNQTALTKHAEGVVGGIRNEQKNVPGGVAGLSYQGPAGKLDPQVIPHPLAVTLPFDLICGLPVSNADATLAVGEFALPVSFAFNIKGWRMLSDHVGTIVVNVGIGPFSGFPANDRGFSILLNGSNHGEQLFSTVVPVAAAEFVKFVPVLAGASLPTSTYISIELVCERTI